MHDISTTVLTSAIDCFKGARNKISEGMRHLYNISESRLWDNGEYSSFGEFCETGCGISESFGSKLIKIFKHYSIVGGIPEDRIANADSEKLYLAINLPGTPDTQLLKAETLTRRDIKDSLAEKDGVECAHEQTITICAGCHRRV